MPLITWMYLRGKCANCQAPISIRYFLVELLTGLTFLGSWLHFESRSPALALVACLILSAFIVAIFIDIEHLIIPDEITIGGMVAGFLLSAVVPELHNVTDRAEALKLSGLGIVVGGGIVYLILRGGKLAFGKEKIEFESETKVIFTETTLKLPDKEVPYEELFHRKTDYIHLFAKTVELSDRCYFNTTLKLTPTELHIGEEKFDPEQIPQMEVLTKEIILPREAMGFGDVKFMAAIGAFFGWQAAIFSLMWSAVLGTVLVLISLIFRRREWGSKIPYGPYIAVAAAIWLFLPQNLQSMWIDYLSIFTQIITGKAF